MKGDREVGRRWNGGKVAREEGEKRGRVGGGGGGDEWVKRIAYTCNCLTSS